MRFLDVRNREKDATEQIVIARGWKREGGELDEGGGRREVDGQGFHPLDGLLFVMSVRFKPSCAKLSHYPTTNVAENK